MTGSQDDSLYPDDALVGDQAELWRRIHPTWWVKDENLGRGRISSAAFEDSRDRTPMSVTISDRLANKEEALVMFPQRFPGYGMASLTAGHARSCGQGVHPLPTQDDPAHAYVVGRKTDSTRRRLLRGTTVLLEPTLTASPEEG